MDGFWAFAGQFWWLVFPLGGMIGGAVHRWGAWAEKNSERRHERRVEELKLRGASHQGGPTGAAPGAGDAPDLGGHAPSGGEGTPDHGLARATPAEVSRVMAEHDAVNARWLDYELDVTKLITYPLMTDVREPLMVAYLRAKRHADALRPQNIEETSDRAALAEYRQAVTDFRVAFDVAEAEALRVRDRDFSDAERTRLATARQLITLSVDRAASPAERRTAYERARKELDGLLSLSADSLEAMREQAARALPAAVPPPRDLP